jgi:sec-independent protein translocase protein TatA
MGIGVWELLIILAIVLLIFGGKRLASLGKDLGGAIKGFKQSMKDDDGKPDAGQPPESPPGNPKIGSSGRVIDAEVDKKNRV